MDLQNTCNNSQYLYFRYLYIVRNTEESTFQKRNSKTYSSKYSSV